MKKQGWLPFAALLIIFFVLCSSYFAEAKDLYKILGVEKNASQREVQKAFHRLSLKYHPDKNPSKSAEAKFAEINNAYEVLSDEEKRKNYDIFKDEQGRARGPEPNAYSDRYSGFQKTDESGGWNNFGYTTFDSPSGNYFGGQESSFSFGFGGNANPFQNIFDSFFGSARGKQDEAHHFTKQGKTGHSEERSNFQGGAQSSSLVEELNLKTFQKKVLDQLDTWAILFIPRASNDAQEKLQLLEQISRNLRGSVKVGCVNCERQQQLCEQQKLWPIKTLRMRLFSLRANEKLSALDYTGEWSATDIKNYCIDVLPRFSKHLEDVGSLNDEIHDEGDSPIAVLLTKKKDTPAIWRALSGLFYKRVVFFDVQIHDDDVTAISKRFKVDSLPAIVGIYVNGKTKVLSSGSGLEQASSSIEELKALLEDLERKSKAAGPKKGKTKADSEIPSLTKKNFENVCSQDTSLCVIGIHKSSRGKDKLKQILKEISQKSLIRKRQTVSSLKKPVSYSVVDAKKQLAFLNAWEKSVSESENIVLIAYKPKKGTYAFYNGPLSLESAENFVMEVLIGDLQLRRVAQDPVLV